MRDKDQKMIVAVAERLKAIGASTVHFVFPEGYEDLVREADGSKPHLDVRLQLVDGDWTIWSGDNQYDTDHRGAWGFGVIRPDTTEAGYLMIAKAMVLEARGAEEEQADLETARCEIDQREIARDTFDPAKKSLTPFQQALADSAGMVDFYWFR